MTQAGPVLHPRVVAVSAVQDCLDDLGLLDMSRTIGRTPGDQVFRIRGYLVETRIAAHALHIAAAHFNQRPISAHAKALSEAVTAALALLDKEIEDLHEANLHTADEIAAARKALKSPRQRMTEGDV